MKAHGLNVDENGMIIEVFSYDTPSAIDNTNAEAVVLIPGDDSFDIADAGNLIKGGIYKKIVFIKNFFEIFPCLKFLKIFLKFRLKNFFCPL